jgi:hypothetical protein
MLQALHNKDTEMQKKEIALYSHQTTAHQRTAGAQAMTEGKEKRCSGHTSMLEFPVSRHNSQVLVAFPTDMYHTPTPTATNDANTANAVFYKLRYCKRRYDTITHMAEFSKLSQLLLHHHYAHVQANKSVLWATVSWKYTT